MKRVLAGAMAAVAILAVAILWTSLPASAKGPSQGVITGPALADPIMLREPGAKTIGLALSHVVEQSGFFTGVFGSDSPHRLAHRPAGDLGPRYTITYSMTPGKVVQYVYPFAEPLPITYMPANQKYWGGNETVGVWFAARIGLRETLIGQGLLAEASSQPTGAIHEELGVSSPSGSTATPFVVATAVLVLAIAAILVSRHRLRRSRVAMPSHLQSPNG